MSQCSLYLICYFDVNALMSNVESPTPTALLNWAMAEILVFLNDLIGMAKACLQQGMSWTFRNTPPAGYYKRTTVEYLGQGCTTCGPQPAEQRHCWSSACANSSVSVWRLLGLAGETVLSNLGTLFFTTKESTKWLLQAHVTQWQAKSMWLEPASTNEHFPW